MSQRIFVVLICLNLAVVPMQAQENLFAEKFRQFTGIVAGVDFFAGSRKEITPFEIPVAEARRKLVAFLGEDIAKGAIFICSSMEQKDSVWEPHAFKMGFKWLLTPLTPEASAQQAVERMRSRMGGELSPEILERLKGRSADLGNRMVETTVLQVGFSVLTTTLAPDREFRFSRLEDMSRSPLADWLDIGLASFAANSYMSNVAFLQRRLEEAFSIEDVLFMSRPVVAPPVGAGFGQGGFVNRMEGSPGSGDDSEGSRMRGGGPSSIPKDVQDRMMYDAQAATFFAFLLEKKGIENLKRIVQLNRQGEEIQAVLERPEFLGTDFEAIENEWKSWVKNQKADPRGMRRGERPPGQSGAAK